MYVHVLLVFVLNRNILTPINPTYIINKKGGAMIGSFMFITQSSRGSLMVGSTAFQATKGRGFEPGFNLASLPELICEV